MSRLVALGALATAVGLSACAAQLHSLSAPAASVATASPKAKSAAAPVHHAERELTAKEKKEIIAVVAPNLKDPAAAKYHWTKVPENLDNASNYCATVDAKSPYPPYSGRQAYIVEITVQDDQIVTAAMGLIAGGKDVALVKMLCAKYGLHASAAG